jgi:hypothetical protein
MPRTPADLQSISEALGLSSLQEEQLAASYQAARRGGDPASTSINRKRSSTRDHAVNVGELDEVFPEPYRNRLLRMIEDYQEVFGGRERELRALNAFLKDPTQQCAMLLAPTGMGKTALLIHWAAQVRRRGLWDVIFVPISRRYQTASANATVGALAYALATVHNDNELLGRIDTALDQLRPLISGYLRRPAPPGRRLLCVLDGLDEATGWAVERDLFPRILGDGVKLVISARQLAGVTVDDWMERLGWEFVRTAQLTLSALDIQPVALILRQMMHLPADADIDSDLVQEVTRVSQGDPLTIRYIAEDLGRRGITIANLKQIPSGLKSYLRSSLDEIIEQSGDEDTYQLLSLCAVAMGPLSLDDIQMLAPDAFYQRGKVRIQRAARAVERFIMGDGSSEQGYIFSHPRLREIFLEDVLSRSEREKIRGAFIRAGMAWLEARTSPLSRYFRQFWVTHMAEHGAWELAHAVVCEITNEEGRQPQQLWAEIRFAAEGSYAGYLDDLDIVRRWAEEQGHIAVALRCSLIAATIQSMSNNIPAALLVKLVDVGTPTGRWSISSALAHIQHMTSEYQQRKALRALLDAKSDLTQSLPEIFEVACGIPYEGRSYDSHRETLAAVASRAPEVQAAAILRIACAIREEEARADALAAIVPSLSDLLLEDVCSTALALRDEDDRRYLLEALIRRLPAEYSFRLIEEARLSAHQQSQLLVATALQYGAAQPDLYRQALEALTDASVDETERLRALEQLAPHLPQELLGQALAIIQEINDDWYKRNILEALAPRLSQKLLDQAFALVLRIDYGWDRGMPMKVLIPYVSSELINRMADTLVWDGDEHVLELLTQQLPPDALEAVLDTGLYPFGRQNDRGRVS